MEDLEKRVELLEELLDQTRDELEEFMRAYDETIKKIRKAFYG